MAVKTPEREIKQPLADLRGANAPRRMEAANQMAGRKLPGDALAQALQPAAGSGADRHASRAATAALAAMRAEPAWLRPISPARLLKKLADPGGNAQLAVGVVSQLLLWALGAAALPALGPPEAGLTILVLLNLAILFWASIARRSKMAQGMMICYLLASLAGSLWWLAAGFVWPGAP